ncbi:MAG: prolyl oligopeptidase family serine peptidase [Clostridia bacterium]|nr:prolyl oligopeptidase family serine peptidase [Clostridia bacterium]
MAVKEYKKLKYVIEYPLGYEEGKHYPVLLHIHGAGGRGNDISIIENHFVLRILREKKESRFIVVSPQCYADTWFEIFEQLIEFTAFIRDESYTDKERFYLAGSSMGGYTTWQMAMTRPEWFAAIIPVCGGGMYWNAARLKNVPVWAHHGLLDPVVKVEESIKMVNAVNAAGGNAKLSVYEKVQHNSWENAFSNEDVYEWMLSHKKVQ